MSYQLLSNRLNGVKPSPTLALMAKAKSMQSSGLDVINLGVGEPDFHIPEWIKAAGCEAINNNFNKYTPVDGILSLKQAVIKKFKDDNNLSYQLDEVMVSNGAKQVIFNALLATLNSEDEVIIPAPYWVSYPDMVSLIGGRNIIVDCDIYDDFKLTPARLEKAISSKTKWLILNSPSNPTGSVYSKEELHNLAHVLLKHEHVAILSDDIYEYLIFDDTKFYNLLMVEPKLKNRTLLVNGLSKSYAMTGWRIGYGAGSKNLISAMNILQSQSTSNPCSIAQFAAVSALNGSKNFLKDWCAQFIDRRNLAIKILQTSPLLELIVPKGAFYIFVNCKKLLGMKTTGGIIINSEQDFCNYLLEQYHVAVVDGGSFGLSPYFRISYPLEISQLSLACQRIIDAVSNLTK